MYRELSISESDGVLAAFNAVCELMEETERLQAACAAKEAELAGLRAQTAELFGARVAAEGAEEDAVSAAKAMWQHDPETAAQAIAGCSIEEAVRAAGCNQYKHKPGCPEEKEVDNAKKKEKQTPSRIKSDSDGGANLLILPTGDVHQVSDNDLKHYKYNTKFSAFHVNKDGTYAGTPEDGLMHGATLDEALNRFPALSDAAKKDVRSFFSANEKNGNLRFYRLKFN